MNHILIMGAGAVGGYFGARLAAGSACEVSFVARGRHLQAMQEEGLTVYSPEGDLSLRVRAVKDPSEAPLPDLVLLCVKSYDTPQAVRQLTGAVREDTLFLSLQNGVENEELLGEAFGEERVIGGLCRIGAGLEEPGVIRHTALGEVTLGSEREDLQEAAATVARLFREAGVPCTLTGDIRHEIWVKFAWNAVFNMITGLSEATVDRLLADPEGEALCRQVFEEVRRVAAARGVTVDTEDERKVIDGARGLEGFVTSTHRDRMNGKKMEYEAFAGAMVRLADRHGLEVPATRTIHRFYRLLEAVDSD